MSLKNNENKKREPHLLRMTASEHIYCTERFDDVITLVLAGLIWPQPVTLRMQRHSWAALASAKMQNNDAFVDQINWFVSLLLFALLAVALRANKMNVFHNDKVPTS